MKFETENAKYNLHPAFHNKITEAKNLEDYDAIILESGTLKYENDLSYFSNYKQYEKIIKDVFELKKPVYSVDMPSKISENVFKDIIGYAAIETAEIIIPFYVSFSAPPATLPLALPLVSLILSPGNSINSIAEADSYLSLSKFYMPAGFRSAISAKKIEEHIAPAIGEEKGEKPNIFVEYGAGHVDMKHYLKSKRLRDSVIKLHSLWNYFPLDRDYLNLIKEFSFDGNPLNLGEVVSNHDYDDGHKEIIS